MGNRKERESKELKDKRRRQLLDSALDLFHQKGIQSVSLSAIARKAELSKAAVYLYFESKEDLIFTLLVENSWKNRDGIKPDNAQTGYQKLCEYVESAKEDYEKDLPIKHLIMNYDQLYTEKYPENLASAVQWQEKIKKQLDWLSEIIELGIRDGSLKADLDSRSAAALLGNSITLFGGTTSVRRNILIKDQGRDPKKEFSDLLDYILAGMKA